LVDEFVKRLDAVLPWDQSAVDTTVTQLAFRDPDHANLNSNSACARQPYFVIKHFEMMTMLAKLP
jgi:hypothetical protein